MKMQRTRQRKIRQPTRRPTRQPADAGRRALWIASALCVWMFVIMGRLMWLQVARHDHGVAQRPGAFDDDSQGNDRAKDERPYGPPGGLDDGQQRGDS